MQWLQCSVQAAMRANASTAAARRGGRTGWGLTCGGQSRLDSQERSSSGALCNSNGQRKLTGRWTSCRVAVFRATSRTCLSDRLSMRRVTLPSTQDQRRRGSAGSAMTTTSPTRGCGEWRTAMILTLRQAPAVPASTHVPTWTKRRRGDVEQRSIGHGGWRQWWRQESAWRAGRLHRRRRRAEQCCCGRIRTRMVSEPAAMKCRHWCTWGDGCSASAPLRQGMWLIHRSSVICTKTFPECSLY